MSRPTCPDVRSWQDLLDGGGAGGAPDEFAQHLEICVACQHTLETLAAGPAVWEDAAQALEDQARQAGLEPALRDLVERLKREQPPAGGDDDLSFLRPADEPGLLGLLSEYEVREVIGRGGMGMVLKAFDPALHRLVAIKVMAVALAGNATARRRFTREARAAAAVCHEHVVAVHGVREADGLPYLVMQYVAGESLQQRLDRAGPLPVEEAVRIGLQAASGLAAAHAQGLIHRDIKPANLLLEGGLGPVKITDFGLARLADDVGLTRAGVVAGTPEYMAPELARGEGVDHRADLFSLGSVLYACCTGTPPFHGATPLAVLRRVSDETPAPVRSLNPGVPAWLEALIARLMAKEPAERIQTAAEVAALLEGYLAHLRQPATVPAPELPPSPPGGPPGSSEPAGRVGVGPRFRGRLGVPALVFFGALGLFGCLVALAELLPGQGAVGEPLAGQAAAAEIEQDFRGSRAPLPPLSLIGPDADAVARLQDEGLRLTLPARRDQPQPVGVALADGLSGDFEVTGTYELLSADRPTMGYGVGVALNLATTQDFKKFAKVGRFVRPEDGDVYVVESWAKDPPANGDPPRAFRSVPTAARAGQLRLVRRGSALSYQAAEGPGDSFRELYRGEFGTDDLAVVRFVVVQNNSPAAVDARLVALRLRGLNPSATQPPEPRAGERRRPHLWLAAAGLSALALVLLPLAAWLIVSRRRRAASVPRRDRLQLP